MSCLSDRDAGDYVREALQMIADKWADEVRPGDSTLGLFLDGLAFAIGQEDWDAISRAAQALEDKP